MSILNEHLGSMSTLVAVKVGPKVIKQGAHLSILLRH